MARDHAVEHWLEGQVGPAFDALKADRHAPSRLLSSEHASQRLHKKG
jgi:hypothetical protein